MVRRLRKILILSLILTLMLSTCLSGFIIPTQGCRITVKLWIYVDFTGLDEWVKAHPNKLTQAEIALLKQKIMEHILNNIRDAIGENNKDMVEVTDDRTKATGMRADIKIDNQRERDSDGNPVWGGRPKGSAIGKVHFPEFMEGKHNDTFRTNNKWNITKLANAIGWVAGHELGHTFSIGHNKYKDDQQNKMTDGSIVEAETMTNLTKAKYDEHSKKAIQENWSGVCEGSKDYCEVYKNNGTLVKLHYWGEPLYENCTHCELSSVDALFNFSGPLAGEFYIGYLGPDTDGGVEDGNSKFDFIYKSSMEGLGADAQLLTFLEGHHDYIQFVLKGKPGSIWEGQWFMLKGENLKLDDFVMTPDGNSVARKAWMGWQIDENPGLDVEVRLDTLAYDDFSNPYNGFQYTCPSQVSTEWAMFGCDPARTHYASSPSPCTNSTLWTYTFGSQIYCSPTVAEGKVFIGSSWPDKNVYALDAQTGTVLWNYTTGYVVYSSPAIADGKVFVGSQDSKIYALNASTGAHIWNYTTGNYVRSSPTVVDGKVFVGSHDSNVYCLNASTGSLLWNYTISSEVESSPAVVDGKVFIGSWDGFAYALNSETGDKIWIYDSGDASPLSTPAVVAGKVYIGSMNNKIYCLDAQTGSHEWNYTTGGSIQGSPAVADGKVFIGSYDGNVYALNAITGELIWNCTIAASLFSSPAVAYKQRLFIGSLNTKIYSLDLETGHILWTYKTGGEVYSSPAIANGTLFIGSRDQKLYAFRSFHDVSVNNVVPSKTLIGRGYSLHILVSVKNQGTFTDSFDLALYGNATLIEITRVDLTVYNSTTITFTWNTTGFAKGNYTISAYAWPVSGETDMDDNLLSNGTVLVGVPCDVTGPTPGVPDGVCNMRDIGYICNHFGTKPSSLNWDPNCDVTGPTKGVPDGIVNMRDIGEACRNFGKKDP